VLLTCQFFLHLLFSLVFLLLLALDLLGLGLHLLLLDHVLNHVGLRHMLVILMVKQLLGLVLFFLRITDLLPHPLLVSLLVKHDLLPLFFFLGVVHHRLLGFFVHALLQPHLLLLLSLHISAALLDDLAGLLPGLVDLLKCSNFFMLQKTNTVAQQLQVLFCSLPGNLGCHQFAVEGLVVIFLVWSEVNFLFFELIGVDLLGVCLVFVLIAFVHNN
jgi:hypothetical protein